MAQRAPQFRFPLEELTFPAPSFLSISAWNLRSKSNWTEQTSRTAGLMATWCYSFKSPAAMARVIRTIAALILSEVDENVKAASSTFRRRRSFCLAIINSPPLCSTSPLVSTAPNKSLFG